MEHNDQKKNSISVHWPSDTTGHNETATAMM
jgi:hypothetical protein